MARRVWLVRPDVQVSTFDPGNGWADGEPVAAVSDEAIIRALAEATTIVQRIGGIVSLTVDRAATGVPGERVTRAALVEWKDRSDAKDQPEDPGSAIGDVSPDPDEAVDESDVPVELRGL